MLNNFELEVPFNHKTINFLSIIKEKVNIKIVPYFTVEGFEHLSGGRNGSIIKGVSVEKVFNLLNKKININIVLSNCFNTEDDIKPLLILFKNFSNQITIINYDDNLINFIKSYDYKVMKSVTSFSFTDINKYDVNLINEYDYICPRGDLIFDFLKIVKSDKIISLLDDNCKVGCHLFKKHSENLSKINKGKIIKMFECPFNLQTDENSMVISNDNFNYLIENNIRKFKITGREILSGLELLHHIEIQYRRYFINI